MKQLSKLSNTITQHPIIPRWYKMGLLLAIVPVLLFISVYHFIKSLTHKPNNNLPPSPFALPFIGHLHLLKHPLHETLLALSKQLGPVHLLHFGAKPVLHVSSQSAAEECLRQHDAVFANRPRLLTSDIFGYDSQTLIWAPYGPLWRNLRRVANLQILSPHPLQRASGVRAGEVRILLRRVLRESENGAKVVNVRDALFDMTHNVMMKLLAKERYVGDEAVRFRDMMVEIMDTEGSTTIVDILPWLKYFGVEKSLRKKFRGLAEEKERFLNDVLEKHKRLMEKEGEGEDEVEEVVVEEEEDEKVEDGSVVSSSRLNKTFMEALLRLQKTDPEFYTDETIKGLFQGLLLAGRDTTVETIEWALALMLNHPAVLKKAQDEIATQVGYDRLLEESDVANLPYLNCIVNETLRMYPVAPLLIPHESSKDCTVGGYTVPSGTMLLVNVWALQNDPKHWDQPKEFRPERFLGVDEDGEDMKYKYMPFGLGRRICPGKGMAKRAVPLALGSLLQCFEWERPGAEPLDMAIKVKLSVCKNLPLKAKIQPRHSMVKFI